MLGLDKKTYELAGTSPANGPGTYKDPGFGWMAGFLAAISFAGLLSLIPLRKVLPSFPLCSPVFYHDMLNSIPKQDHRLSSISC